MAKTLSFPTDPWRIPSEFLKVENPPQEGPLDKEFARPETGFPIPYFGAWGCRDLCRRVEKVGFGSEARGSPRVSRGAPPPRPKLFLNGATE